MSNLSAAHDLQLEVDPQLVGVLQPGLLDLRRRLRRLCLRLTLSRGGANRRGHRFGRARRPGGR